MINNSFNGKFIFAIFLWCVPLLSFGQIEKNTNGITNNKIITFYPLQMFTIGEYRISYEQQIKPDKFNIYGIGLIHFNRWFFDLSASDEYYGIKLFFGKKKVLKNDTYISFLLFSKYVVDKGLDLINPLYDRWYSIINHSDERPYIIKERDKYILGMKFLISKQSSQYHKIQEGIYCGLGIRMIYYDYNDDIDKTRIDKKIFNFLVMPSIHLGYSIGYNLKRK